MRRILLAATGTLVATVAVLLYPTSTNQPVTSAVGTTSAAATAADADSSTTAAAPSATGSATTAPSTGSATTTPSTSGSTDGGTAAAPASGTFTSSTSMRYGTVMVTVTVADGQITDVSGSQDSNDSKSQRIASQAIPTLNSEAVAAQSASISLVSHATYTSQAYAQSLQAAIDQAFGS